MTTSPQSKTPDRTWLVALAASLWGLDNLLRKPVAAALSPATVVLWEHLIVVIVLIPFIPAALRVFGRCSWRDRLALIAIGVGASAVATALFTQAFKLANYSPAPLVLQQLQPLFAVALAVILLKERLHPRFAMYAVPAIAGVWLLNFADPFHVKLAAVQSALLALAAAFLWGAGTVLGRMVSPAVPPRDLTTLRYIFGAIGALGVTFISGAPVLPGWHSAWGLVLLALIPGLLALTLYYIGLRSTAASRATFAEMSYPTVGAIVGVLFLHATLTWSQWLGAGIVVAVITALSLHERTSQPAVEVPLLSAA